MPGGEEGEGGCRAVLAGELRFLVGLGERVEVDIFALPLGALMDGVGTDPEEEQQARNEEGAKRAGGQCGAYRCAACGWPVAQRSRRRLP